MTSVAELMLFDAPVIVTQTVVYSDCCFGDVAEGLTADAEALVAAKCYVVPAVKKGKGVGSAIAFSPTFLLCLHLPRW